MITLPLGLRNALDTGECVLFVGAGIGTNLRDSQGKAAPLGTELAKELADSFAVTTDEYDLSKVAKIVEIRHSRANLEAFLSKRLANLEPDENVRWLFSLRWKAIFTTNYDNGIQRAYELNPKPVQRPVTITMTPEIARAEPNFDVPVYHLHGALFGSQRPQIIITQDDYVRFREKRGMLFNLLKLEFATATILYIGYSNQDPNWRTVLEEMSAEFYPSPLPRAYRVAPHTNPIDDEILKSKGIESIDLSLEDFAKVASLTTSQARLNQIDIQKISSNVPPDIRPAFEKNPAAVARILSSWTYVNQATFSDRANVAGFLHGDRPNWSLIASRQHFERDIEEEICDNLLDFATVDTKKPSVDILLGPAGYGTTTLLMTLAARLVQEDAGVVFMLNPGSSLLEGDIEFAATMFPRRVFFFVDNAADHGELLSTAIHRLKEMKQPAMFVLGERINEWRQMHFGVAGEEFELEPLSDPEIGRLLDCLKQHGELNALEHLSREMQFAAIKMSHRKELLVAMREATEGRGFDAILEDEFRGIQDPFSRRLYLIVCCFYQHGAYVRDGLLAQLMERSLPDLYKATKDSTDGVVIYDCIDQSLGRYAARARHRTIAAVVWERCSNLPEKDALILKALDSLNLNYNADKEAFEFFIRSDHLVDNIATLEGKTRFFESACRKEPQSPYVRQHYARMLLRADKPELALTQIDEALALNPRVRVLYHTKGTILSDLAARTESVEIARRRLAQSEECFRRGLSIHAKDEYSYQGLARMYLSWAQRGSTPIEEATEYISKAEGIINEGLKVVRVRDSLLIESANIQAFIGNKPLHLQALEQAVRESPQSLVARYLLGRAYRKAGNPAKSIEVLDPVIKNQTDEFRTFVEYAISLVHLGRSYKEAIAILQLSKLYGLSDPRFIATLGGLQFLDHDIAGSAETFHEATKRNFTSTDFRTVFFRPPDPANLANPLRLRGTVRVVRAGYCLLDCVEYPRFLCLASKFNGVLMRPGLKLVFEPVFTAKGPLADRPAAE